MVELPPMVVIPAGTSLIGSPERSLSALAKAYGGTRESYREEAPQHRVALNAFAIAKVPVTNRLYAEFVAAGGAPPPAAWRGAMPPAALAECAVAEVSWHAARAFCQWLGSEVGRADLRLPSEAEWEYAATGGDGRRFPWGEAFAEGRAATREAGSGLQPVGRYAAGASPFGVLDLAGTVWEWTSSLDRVYPYRADDGRELPSAEGRRILRGGCYANPHGFARCACRFRLAPATVSPFVGLRIAGALGLPSA